MTDSLTTGLRALAEVESPVTWPDVVAQAATGPASAPQPHEPRHQRRAPRRALAAAVVLVVGAAVLLWPDDPDGPAEDVHTQPGPEAPTTADPLPPATPTTTAPTDAIPPLETGRFAHPVTAVTDTHLLVWGGEDGTGEIDRNDGFAVDLATGGVTVIPPAPFPAAGGSQGAWTGRELIVWAASAPACGPCDPPAPGAAAWDPQTGAWRTITPPPVQAATAAEGSVWTDEVILTVAPGIAVTYDPATDRWDEVPALPVVADLGPKPSLVWTGSEAVWWSSQHHGSAGPAAADGEVDRGWTWSPGDREWTRLPPLPVGSRTQMASVAWTGSDLVVWGTSVEGDGTTDVGVGALWRPGDDTWRPMSASPQPPGRGYEGTPGSQALAVDASTGRVLVQPLDLGGGVEPRSALVYDPGTDTWATTDLVVDGHNPTMAVVDGTVLVPDAADPVIGEVGG